MARCHAIATYLFVFSLYRFIFVIAVSVIAMTIFLLHFHIIVDFDVIISNSCVKKY